jgi:hypothetical protein
VRHRPLYVALSAFATEAGYQLAADTAQGAEVPFEVVETRARRRSTPLYCYRPIVDAFVRERAGMLAHLPSYPAAVRAVSALDGVGDYVRAHGETQVPVDGRERADLALCVFISRVFAEAGDFALNAAHLDRAYAELEAELFDGRAEVVVVAPVLGLRLASPEVHLADGLALVRGDEMEGAPPEAVWATGTDEPAVLACLTLTDDPGAPAPLTVARVRLARLVGALRLYSTAVVALGPGAWWRTGAGKWALAGLDGSGRPRETLLVAESDEDELRAFCSLVARRLPRSGELPWALRRFELGCERSAPFETLTDHLLGLRALLEPEGPGSARLAGRVAALCAGASQRVEITERIARAAALERSVITGLAPSPEAVQPLIEEISSYLRALLRDVLCGHLDADLVSVADDLLAEDAAQTEAPTSR